MASDLHTIETNIDAFLESYAQRDLLRFMTCGSVDDGKSTLIGRLLYESQQVFSDQLVTLAKDSKAVGTRDGELDFALLVDGLAAEREQGITIDVAYRFFRTDQRKFIVADTPGHEQYTRNMVTGASTADLAILLVDARKGLLTQTRRHSYLVGLLGVRHVILAVNKMDLVAFDQTVFTAIAAEYRAFAAKVGVTHVTVIPVCAVDGDNVVQPSQRMDWYRGPTVLAFLETVDVTGTATAQPLRLPVQYVSRPDAEFRGFAGRIASGLLARGARVRVAPNGLETHIARIVTPEGDVESAREGRSVMVTLTDEVDVSRGDVIAAASAPLECAAQFEASVIWMHEEPLLQGRQYLVKIGTQLAAATVAPIKHKINVNTLEQLSAEKLELNEIGICELVFDRPVPFESYASNRALGGCILIDRLTNQTVGAALIHFALRRSQNIHWQALDVNRTVRGAQKGQKGCVLWLTGLSGSGKSTIANLVDKHLVALGKHTYVLDGDNVRHGLNKDLGFSAQDRVENIRRVAEVARLMADAGLITLVSFISPFRSERQMARTLVGAGEFFEVYVDTPLAVAEQRDVKGLYKKARAGQLQNFTGIDSPYEAPEQPEIHIDTTRLMPAEAALEIVARLTAAGVLAPESLKS
jgi:bifunctional enzyme CysN/CysC